ncbi:hypothetical protein RYX36_000444, partial [Vicia faba]
ETSKERAFREESRTREGALPLRSSSGISSIGGYQKQKGIIIHNKNDKAKAEAWEKAKLQRIQKRYEKMKLQILSWEGEKRIQAKIQMERKKNEMDHQRENVIEHYKRKIARLDMIGQRAIKELEDQRRKQELKVKEKANKIKKTGRVSWIISRFQHKQKSINAQQDQENNQTWVIDKGYHPDIQIQEAPMQVNQQASEFQKRI